MFIHLTTFENLLVSYQFLIFMRYLQTNMKQIGFNGHFIKIKKNENIDKKKKHMRLTYFYK